MQNFKKVLLSFVFAVVLLSLPSAVYAESVGGVYPGMSWQQVLQLYGKPDYLATPEQSRRLFGENVALYIWKNGMTIGLDGTHEVHRVGIVSRQFLATSDRKFDYCGLDADSSLTQYQEFYLPSYVGTEARHFEHNGFNIWVEFLPDNDNHQFNYVELNRYTN